MGEIETDIRIEGDGPIVAALTSADERAPREIDRYLNELGIYAQASMLLYAHGARLAQKIARTRAVATASGDHEASVGVRGPEVWPLYVHEGTGIYAYSSGRMSGAGRLITARADRGPASVISTGRGRLTKRHGGVMRFIGREGVPVFRAVTKGQRPNPYAERAYDQTRIYARATAGSLPRRIFNNS